MRKRSLSIAGHRTSIALEPAFWDALTDIAAARNLSIPALIEQIDANRDSTNLSSAIRVAILNHYRQQVADPD